MPKSLQKQDPSLQKQSMRVMGDDNKKNYSFKKPETGSSKTFREQFKAFSPPLSPMMRSFQSPGYKNLTIDSQRANYVDMPRQLKVDKLKRSVQVGTGLKLYSQSYDQNNKKDNISVNFEQIGRISPLGGIDMSQINDLRHKLRT